MIDRKYFKTWLAHQRQAFMAPQIFAVLEYTIQFCESIGIHPIITETVTTEAEDLLVKREHDQHRKCVAFDLRVHDLSPDVRLLIERELDDKFNDIAYVNGSGKKEIAFCHGEGDNIHFHVAVNARFKLPEFKA